ncbi:MAG: FecR domain-containing protein [Rhodospirillales bacterium]|nr:FecR domain-containing protein [Rhodospirillales bacterium]
MAISIGEAKAATPPIHVGHSITIEKNVRGQISGQKLRRIILAEKIFFNENIITGDDSVIVIQFRDGSTFEIGANGSAVIDELAFNPAEGKSSKIITLTQGTFRYISGFIATQSEFTLNTPTGTIGIRGSAVSGVIQPNVPTFFHVSSGSATYTNDAGTSSVGEGQSMAAPSRTTPPMQPERMPPAVTAQVLQLVQATLGAPPAAQALSSEQRAADAAANTVPTALQQNAQAQIAPPPTAAVPAPAAPAAGLSLLTAAANVGLLSAAAPAAPTAAQQTFIAQAQAAVPNAAAIISTASAQDKQQNTANTAAGTVITGASENAQNAGQIAAVIQSAVGANPNIAGVIATSATVGAAANSAVSATDAAQAVTSGAVQGAVGAGVDVSAVAQAAAGAVIAGTVQVGGNVAEIAAAASNGAVRAAALVNVDVAAIAQASTTGVVTAAGAANLEVADLAAASQQGAISAAEATGADVTAIVQATNQVAGVPPAPTDTVVAPLVTEPLEILVDPEVENPTQNASPS